MRFEPLKFKHLSQMVEIEKEAFDQPWSEAMFIPEVENENAHYIVLVSGEEVIAYGGFHYIIDEAHITNIAVRKDQRGKGVGKMLMLELINQAKALGAVAMTLEVKDVNTPAINMYTSFGFKIEGVRPKYYNNTNDAYIMWKTLENAESK